MPNGGTNKTFTMCNNRQKNMKYPSKAKIKKEVYSLDLTKFRQAGCVTFSNYYANFNLTTGEFIDYDYNPSNLSVDLSQQQCWRKNDLVDRLMDEIDFHKRFNNSINN